MTTPANSVPAVIWPSKTPNTVLASVTAPTSELMTASFGLFCRFPRQRGRFEFIPRFLGLHLRRSREAGESLGRVDIRDDAVAVHLDLDDQLGMGGDHVAGADIPGNARELREEAARQQHGIAALAAPGRHANSAAFERVEGGEEAVERAGAGLGHVGQANHRPCGPGRERGRTVCQRSRYRTESRPLTWGERAQPGSPSTGPAPTCPISMRLPGSTGMPKWSMAPPACSIAAGITSRRSTMAEAPATSTSSAPAASVAVMCGARSAWRCSQRCSKSSVLPRATTPSRGATTVLSRILSLLPGSLVWMSAARLARNGRPARSRPALAPSRTHASADKRPAAHGI